MPLTHHSHNRQAEVAAGKCGCGPAALCHQHRLLLARVVQWAGGSGCPELPIATSPSPGHHHIATAVGALLEALGPAAAAQSERTGADDAALLGCWEASLLEIERAPLGRPALDHALGSVGPAGRRGLWLEFGVARGATLFKMARAAHELGADGPDRVYGFDSFLGLPERWREGAFGEGKFARGGIPPALPEDAWAGKIRFITGVFDTTLPEFLAARPGQTVELLHVDCDLYSSAKTVLRHIRPRLARGSIVVFDELINYGGAQSHEFRACWEELLSAGIGLRWAGCRAAGCMAVAAVVR